MSDYRVLGAVRQSKTRDRAVSPETQRARIRAFTDTGGYRLVKITEDLSRSGKLTAFKRPELGPWLTEPDKIAAWDILVATKLDRACRNTQDYLRLRQWAAEHGKRIVFLNSPELDESTPGGKAMGTITAAFAEFERDMIVERRLETLATLADQGRWAGGRVPYGHRVAKRETGYYLVVDDGGTAEVVRSMARMAIAGKSYGQIAAWLTDDGHGLGHLNSVHRKWTEQRVGLFLHSSTLLEVLGPEVHAELRAALRSRRPDRGERIGAHLLLRVAYCRQCKAALYGDKLKGRPYGGYYRCNHCRFHLQMRKLEQDVTSLVLFLAGDLELSKRALVPGDDHQAQVRQLQRDIDALSVISGTDSVISAKRAEIAELRSAPQEADRYALVGLGVTVAEHWETLATPAEQGSFLRSYEVRVFADPKGLEFHGGWLRPDTEESSTYLFPLEIHNDNH